jgi:hypothetical protein
MATLAIRIQTVPVDRGTTVETSLVSGSIADGILQLTDAQNKAMNDLISFIRGGEDTSVIETVLGLETLTGISAYAELADADVLEVVDAAVGLENMSSAQKAGLLAYIAAIIAEEDTSGVETAIEAIGEE